MFPLEEPPGGNILEWTPGGDTKEGTPWTVFNRRESVEGLREEDLRTGPPVGDPLDETPREDPLERTTWRDPVEVIPGEDSLGVTPCREPTWVTHGGDAWGENSGGNPPKGPLRGNSWSGPLDGIHCRVPWRYSKEGNPWRGSLMGTPWRRPTSGDTLEWTYGPVHGSPWNRPQWIPSRDRQPVTPSSGTLQRYKLQGTSQGSHPSLPPPWKTFHRNSAGDHIQGPLSKVPLQGILPRNPAGDPIPGNPAGATHQMPLQGNLLHGLGIPCWSPLKGSPGWGSQKWFL
jgi:hypothetical protein